MLVIFLTIGLLPIFLLSVISIQETRGLGDDIVEDSEQTKESTAEYLFSTLTERQENHYRNYTQEKADEYTNFFLQFEQAAEVIALYSLFMHEHPELGLDPPTYDELWLSPPYADYNAQNPTDWDFVEGDLYAYNDTIARSKVLLELIKTLMHENSGIGLGYFAYPDNITVFYPDVSDALRAGFSDFYPPARPWYELAMNSTDTVWTEPYIEATEATMTLTCTRAVWDEEELVGVFGLDIFLDDFTDDVLESEFGLHGEAFVINERKEAVVAPWLNYTQISQTGEFPSVSDQGDRFWNLSLDEMADQRAGYERVILDGEHYFLSYAPIGVLNFSLGILFPVSEILDPVYNVQSEIENNLVATENKVEERSDGMVLKSVVLLLLFMVLVGGTTLYFAQRLVAPIQTLTQGAEQVGMGDLEYRVQVDTEDELETLAESFNNMAAYLDAQMQVVEETAKVTARIERELQIAQDIQMGFLPKAPPEVEGYQLAGLNVPAREVGGDFFDYIELPENKLGIVVADVSGKGVPAALFMVISKTLLRANAKHILDPVEAVELANQVIVEESDSGMFITLFYAILDPVNHTLQYINGGHNPPMHFSSEGPVSLLKASGIPMGIMEEMNLESKQVDLGQNELVFIYTDGVTEAEDIDNAEYGEARLEALIRDHGEASTGELIELVAQDIKDFAGERDQFDDITMVALRSMTENASPPQNIETDITDEGPGSEAIMVQASFDTELGELSRVQEFVEQFLKERDLEEYSFDFQMAVEEYFTNIIKHGFGGGSGGEVQLQLKLEGENLTIEFKDNGPEFDPHSIPPPEPPKSIEEARIGGLGLHFIRQLMDQTHYERSGDLNHFVMTKSLA